MEYSRQSVHADLRRRLRRVAVMTPSVAQCAVAAALAWLVARDVLGHPRPFFAPIAVVICIGVATGQRLRRLAELVVGVTLGVGVGDLLISQIGSGAWQIALVVALAMLAAVFLDSGSLIVLQAGSSAVLVATLLPPTGSGGFDRMVDALVGGLLGIAAVAVLPASPRTIVHRHASPLFEALAAALDGAAQAINHDDPERARRALEAARLTQPLVAGFSEALQTSMEITTISPLYRQRRRHLQAYQTAFAPLDHALRNTRVLLRHSVSVLGEHQIPAETTGALTELARATLLLRDELAASEQPASSRAALLGVAGGLHALNAARAGFSAQAITVQLVSITFDLLQAAGLDQAAATDALPKLDAPPD
ncbi:FUSC family protein [Nonomuraea sp. NPDC005983]|uniref:FUSC family protein n=1 Tax=Nonomuraea sp. NPDC005983 TaxID=3155595 RepID=UPI0033BE8654